MRRILVTALLIAGPASEVQAQLRAHVDRTAVQTGQEVRLALTLDNVQQFPDPQIPDLGRNFEIYFRGTSQQTSIVNGRMSTSITKNYVIRAKKEGTFTIPAIAVVVDGQRFETEPFTLTVSAAPPPPAPPPLSEGETGSTAGSRDIFARATVDKSEVFLYEQVTFRVRLYTAVDLLDNPSYNEPTTQGFWREPLPAIDPYLQTVEGRRYRVLEVAIALFPTTPGDLTIGPASLECITVDPSRGRDSFSFFRNMRDGKRVTLTTDPVPIKVKPLPPDAPPGFAGAVGEYSMHLAADRTEVAQGEPVTLTLTLSGAGHLRTVGNIEIRELPNFRSYPAESSEEILRAKGVLGGRITKQFVLVPLTAGRHRLPPVQLVTFSPREGTYKTISGPELIITATPGDLAENLGTSRGDIEVLGRDIRFIETDLPNFAPVERVWGRAGIWLTLVPLPVFAYGGIWLWDRRRRRLGGDIALRRRLNAAREARKMLKSSGRTGATEAAVTAANALRNYVADRFNLPRAGLTPDRIETELDARGIDAGPLLGFLDRCDADRYAPGEGSSREDWEAEALEHLKSLEQQQ